MRPGLSIRSFQYPRQRAKLRATHSPRVKSAARRCLMTVNKTDDSAARVSHSLSFPHDCSVTLHLSHARKSVKIAHGEKTILQNPNGDRTQGATGQQSKAQPVSARMARLDWFACQRWRR